MLSAEIIAIGSELLTPRFQDTNSIYLTEQLNQAGISVVMKSIAGDNEDYLEHAIRGAIARTPVVITIGGLGPTEDDITRKVISQVTQRPLQLNDAILEKLRKRFANRGVEMQSNNERQALVPTGAEPLDNAHGTAPGIWIEDAKNTVILLPGPPRELEPMFETHCLPRLMRKAGTSVLVRRVYRTTGLPESTVDGRISPLYSQYSGIETTVLAKPGQVDVHLAARGRSQTEAEALVAELGERIEAELVDHVFATSYQEMEEVVGMYLVMKGATISVAESCTGGMVAERLTRVPGSSQYFLSGIVSYSNQSKIDLAGIPPLLLQMEGAVSREVAIGLAEGVRDRVETTIGVGVTGVAGPAGGSAEKPVGTVHIAVAGPGRTEHGQFLFPGGRERIRWQSSQAALDMVRRFLETL
jgi:nicotinamide-nucleotide amidase